MNSTLSTVTKISRAALMLPWLLCYVTNAVSAEPNHSQNSSVDPYYADGSQWGMYGDRSPLNQNKFGSQAGEAFAAGRKCRKESDVVIGMVGDSVIPDHEDLKQNIWTNELEIAGNGIDDDGNGFIDDIHGWNFRLGNNELYDANWAIGADFTGYAGVVGAATNNGIGVAGMCGNVKMIISVYRPFRTADYSGPMVAAMDYVTNLKTRQGLNIVAMQVDVQRGFNQAIYEAIERAKVADILIVSEASIGHTSPKGATVGDDLDLQPSYPNSNLIKVASLESDGHRWSATNYGLNTVHIGAPAWGYTTGSVDNGFLKPRIPGYHFRASSGMSAAHVVGAAALYASLHPGASAEQIKAAILDSAVPTRSLAGKTVTGGRLNVSGF